MHIAPIPYTAAVARLLQEAGLPTADLAPAAPVEFFACGPADAPYGVVALERRGEAALLRSLAVRPDRRRTGVGSRLVAHVEAEARRQRLERLYLLTATAEPFFARRGYRNLARAAAPAALRASREFEDLCPQTAAFMSKELMADASGEFAQQTIATADGGTITARVFGDPGSARGGIVIVPAMGVAQPYYAALAGWLAARGWLALTFDYRGMGLSRAGSLRGLRLDIIDWARFDCAAALDALAARVPGKPLVWIGHSLGGQIIPFVPNRERVAKFITIATGSGYWRENAAPLKPRAWLLWFVLAPLLVHLFGYFPGRRFGMVGDLPPAVMRQWRRWCLDPEYAIGAEGEAVRRLYASVRTPIVSLSFTDDEMMSARNTESMHGFYTAAPRKMIRLAPHEVGLARIGHFGFFRAELAEALWRERLLPELAPAEAGSPRAAS